MHEFQRAGVFGLVWLAVGVGCAYAVDGEEKSSQRKTVAPPVQISPLDQIWALDMPGTRDISKYDFGQDDPRIKKRDPRVKGRITTDLLRSTLRIKPPKQDALPAILLRQSDRTNLYQMLRVAGATINVKDTMHRVRFQQIRDRFLLPPTDNRFSLFFYTHPSAYRVELAKVERRGLEIDIQYRFVPRFSAESSVHWALIPLGELPAGDYRVNITKLPMEQKFLDAGFKPVSEEETKRIVCQPADFFIRYAPEKKEVIHEEKAGEETVVIPLDQIWAWRMPGTKPMNAGLKAGKYIADEGPLLGEIRKHLSKLQGKDWEKKAGKGFVVVGTDMETMRKSHATLVGKEKRSSTFSEDEELSLAFFSYSSTWYIHIHDVVKQGNKIKVRYKFVPHRSANLTKHFALIPLNNIRKGKYKVVFERLPLEQQYVKEGWPPRPAICDKLVCESFKFTVNENLGN